jgi:methylaspartate mutase sigma subunit
MSADDRPLDGRTVVAGVIGDDVHVLGIRLVEHALRAAGAKVVSLGVMTPQEEFVHAAVETAADVVVISSSNGHAAISCAGIGDAFAEAGLADLPLYLGGNLQVGSRERSPADLERHFRALGFTRVFTPEVDLGEAIQVIAGDLEGRR